MRKTIQPTILLTLTALLCLSGCKKETESYPTKQKKKSTVTLSTGTYSEVAITLAHSAPASVHSLNSSLIKAQLSAQIQSIAVRVGDHVKKGDVLAQLNCSDARAQLQQANSQINAASASMRATKLELERAQTLNQKHSISASLLNQRESQYAAARSQYQASIAGRNLAKNNVQRCTLTAPFDGVITQRIGQVGELATYGSPLVKLVSTQDAEISADIEPNDVQSLQLATDITFKTNSSSKVKLRHIVSSVDSTKRTQEARLTFINETEAPLSGTPGRLLWSDPTPAIPSTYFTERKGQLGVFIIQDGTAIFKALPNAKSGRAATVKLDQETLIVTKGQHNLKDQQYLRALLNNRNK